MDFQSILAYFFSALAFGLPLLLVLSHVGTNGWQLGPPFYSGLIAALATVAMTARVSAFLDAQILEPRHGWFTKDMLVGLFVLFLAAVALAIFGWLIPQMRLSVSTMLRSLWRETPVFDLAASEVGDPVSLANFLANFARTTLGLLAIGAYLFWPAIILSIDAHQQHQQTLDGKEAQAQAEIERSRVRQHALSTARNANAVLVRLLSRRDTCAPENCAVVYQLEIRKVQAELSALGVKPAPAGLYLVDDFANALGGDRDKALLADDSVRKFARRWGVPLAKQSLPALAEFNVVAMEEKEHHRQQRSDARLLARFSDMLASPAKMFLLLSKDLTLAFAIAMEIVAIVLAFAVGSDGGRRTAS